MSILYELLEALGLIKKQKPRRIARYAHPSHDPNWKGHRQDKAGQLAQNKPMAAKPYAYQNKQVPVNYNQTRPVQKPTAPPKVSSQKLLGRNLTEKEVGWFKRMGFDEGWRGVSDALSVIAWLHAHLTPIEFENFCVAILRAHNVSIDITEKNPVSGADGGFDGKGTYVLDGKTIPIAMQAKRFAPHRQVGYDHCDRFVGGLFGDGIDHGFLITTGTFSEEAIRRQDNYRQRGIQLEMIDQDYLIKIMARRTTNPHGFGLHITEHRMVYVNIDILLKAAGRLK